MAWPWPRGLGYSSCVGHFVPACGRESKALENASIVLVTNFLSVGAHASGVVVRAVEQSI